VTRAEVAIIGAGPAGAAAALRLGQLGVRDVVLVDRADFPRDKTCGSGLSPRGIRTLRELGVWEAVAPHAYPISGLRLVTPADRELYLSGGEAAAAVVCPRRILDHVLLERARALGVRFVPDFPVATLSVEDGRVVGFVARDGRGVRARHTLVADGALSSFTVDRRPPRLMQAIMGWWQDVPFRAHHVEMVFDRRVTPGYGWLFPESAHRVNIGICYEDPGHRRNGRRLFETFLATHYARRLAGATPAGRLKGHPIAYTFRPGRLGSPGRLVMGEAGRMVHPATAEGISQGLRSGVFAAEALAPVLLEGRSERRAIAAYEARCRRAFGLSFGAARLWRAAVTSSALDRVVAAVQRPAVKTALGRLMAAM
jgi:flavin-dependent dehydrogenase